MTKEILLSIRGLQFEGSMDGDKIETITSGVYYKKNDLHYVAYEEVMEGFEETTKSLIKVSDRELTLTKRGPVNVNMVFEQGKKNVTNYNTPYGNILIGMDTNRIQLVEREEKIEVEVEYSLEINYEHLADCSIKMDIMAKDVMKKT